MYHILVIGKEKLDANIPNILCQLEGSNYERYLNEDVTIYFPHNVSLKKDWNILQISG